MSTENKTQFYLDIAANIRSKRTKQPEKETKKDTTIQDFLKVALELKNKRLAISKKITPIKVNRIDGFRCVNKENHELTVQPSIHAIAQFTKRYVYFDPNMKEMSYAQVVEYMRSLFNNTCERRAGKDYQYRNNKRRDVASALIWGCDSMSFVVNPELNLIMTFELTGKCRPLNKTLSRINSDAFNRREYTALKSKDDLVKKVPTK